MIPLRRKSFQNSHLVTINILINWSKQPISFATIVKKILLIQNGKIISLRTQYHLMRKQTIQHHQQNSAKRANIKNDSVIAVGRLTIYVTRVQSGIRFHAKNGQSRKCRVTFSLEKAKTTPHKLAQVQEQPTQRLIILRGGVVYNYSLILHTPLHLPMAVVANRPKPTMKLLIPILTVQLIRLILNSHALMCSLGLQEWMPNAQEWMTNAQKCRKMKKSPNTTNTIRLSQATTKVGAMIKFTDIHVQILFLHGHLQILNTVTIEVAIEKKTTIITTRQIQPSTK